MDNERAHCERTDITARMSAPLESGNAQGGTMPQGLRQAVQEDPLVTSRLLTVVSEVIETMVDALAQDRETARDCARYASVALLSCAREVDKAVDTEHDSSTTQNMFRGGLAPWQVRRLSAYIDANLNTSV